MNKVAVIFICKRLAILIVPFPLRNFVRIQKSDGIPKVPTNVA